MLKIAFLIVTLCAVNAYGLCDTNVGNLPFTIQKYKDDVGTSCFILQNTTNCLSTSCCNQTSYNISIPNLQNIFNITTSYIIDNTNITLLKLKGGKKFCIIFNNNLTFDENYPNSVFTIISKTCCHTTTYINAASPPPSPLKFPKPPKSPKPPSPNDPPKFPKPPSPQTDEPERDKPPKSPLEEIFKPPSPVKSPQYSPHPEEPSCNLVCLLPVISLPPSGFPWAVCPAMGQKYSIEQVSSDNTKTCYNIITHACSGYCCNIPITKIEFEYIPTCLRKITSISVNNNPATYNREFGKKAKLQIINLNNPTSICITHRRPCTRCNSPNCGYTVYQYPENTNYCCNIGNL
jgi:hypothetical protein